MLAADGVCWRHLSFLLHDVFFVCIHGAKTRTKMLPQHHLTQACRPERQQNDLETTGVASYGSSRSIHTTGDRQSHTPVMHNPGKRAVCGMTSMPHATCMMHVCRELYGSPPYIAAQLPDKDLQQYFSPLNRLERRNNCRVMHQGTAVHKKAVMQAGCQHTAVVHTSRTED